MYLLASVYTRIWTVLCRLVRPVRLTPFLIVFSWTEQSENVHDLLEPMISEIKSVFWRGVRVAGVEDPKILEVIPVVRDHSSRVFVKRETHSGHGSCDKCTQQGVHFLYMDNPPITDLAYRRGRSADASRSNPVSNIWCDRITLHWLYAMSLSRFCSSSN